VGNCGGTSRNRSLARKSELVLEKGMVLVEPHGEFLAPGGDGALVTDGAPVMLSPKFNTYEPFIAG
jgi:hypothetical protein